MSGLLLFGDTERSAALRHEIPLAIMDPVLFAEVDGRCVVLTSILEQERIMRALPGAEVLDLADCGMKDLVMRGWSASSGSRRRSFPAISRSRSVTACATRGSP
jgi:hypothetical protein